MAGSKVRDYGEDAIAASCYAQDWPTVPYESSPDMACPGEAYVGGFWS